MAVTQQGVTKTHLIKQKILIYLRRLPAQYIFQLRCKKKIQPLTGAAMKNVEATTQRHISSDLNTVCRKTSGRNDDNYHSLSLVYSKVWQPVGLGIHTQVAHKLRKLIHLNTTP